MFAFTNVVKFFTNKFARLGRRRFSFPLVPARPLNSRLTWHDNIGVAEIVPLVLARESAFVKCRTQFYVIGIMQNIHLELFVFVIVPVRVKLMAAASVTKPRLKGGASTTETAFNNPLRVQFYSPFTMTIIPFSPSLVIDT
jgi:hypothetical protein